jgi:methyl-accepting chemotaxis protein
MKKYEKSYFLNCRACGMISAITEQTKIIAFNAELEASSAGEAGRTFQIVAGEIRRLAGSTDDSTREIKERIEKLMASPRELAESRDVEEASVGRGTETVRDLQSIFARLAEYSAESDRKINSSIEAQIRTFQQTLQELKKVGAQMDSFKTAGGASSEEDRKLLN